VNDVDYIIASHVVPYTWEIFAETMYLTLSKPTIEILKPSLKHGGALYANPPWSFSAKLTAWKWRPPQPSLSEAFVF